MKKRIILTSMVCIWAYLFTSCSSNEETRNAAPLRVKTETLEATSDFYQRAYVGVVEEQSSVSMSFTGSGMLANVCVNEGEYVRKGQLIAELDKTQAHNMLTAAKAQMKQAEDAYARLKQLHEANSLPEMEWVEVQSKVEQAQAQLELAQKALQDCSIYAPVNGVVGNSIMHRGETVLPSMPVTSILDISGVKVRVSIPEKEIAFIQSHSPTIITLEALPGQTFQGGKIEKLSEANAMTHTYDIKVNLDNKNRTLLPGMVAKVLLSRPTEEMFLSVPITAVRRSADGKEYVWRVVDGKAHRAVIEKGDAAGNRIQVLSGLKAGDVVVTEGYQKLSEGMEVI